MLASNNRILNSSLAPQASQLYSSSNTSLTNIQQCPAHSRGTSLTTERRIVRFAADTMGGEENLTMASERLQNWRERTRRNPHLPSSLRQCSYSRKRRTTPQQPAFEYIIIVSGQGVQDKAKARHTVSNLLSLVRFPFWYAFLDQQEVSGNDEATMAHPALNRREIFHHTEVSHLWSFCQAPLCHWDRIQTS